ncbi:4Fe-4S dicluster domain-containing protein [Adlercreutzia sp. ZJ138]|uniref:4Fe-4S dicluster domain-containing protein n=1 Tax=Adlercreutzia sp. ZJ138 TaxID=2709405 RepID=UPI0013ECA477|nr:4Fe-4S dicluster domain-containing protein [Adlercreutzia sp. ZJ138]
MLESQNISRRSLVAGGAALGCAFLVGGKLVFPTGQAVADSGETPETVQYGFWCDASFNNDFKECVEACRTANNIPADEEALCEVRDYLSKYGRYRHVFTSCMHCADPSCMKACPASAISKRQEDGIVVVDHDRCIGCKYCNTACPFDVPRYNASGMVKCDACLSAGRTEGKAPACVEAVANGALHFGPIDDLIKESGGRAMQITAPTGPSYLLS